MHPFEQTTTHTQKNAVPLAFRLEKDDLFTFYNSAISRSAGDNKLGRIIASKHGVWIVGAVVLLVVIAALYLFRSSLISNFWFLCSLVLFVALAAISARLFFIGKVLLPTINGPTLGRRSYDIEPDGLILTQDGVQQAFMWQSIVDIVEDEKTIYLFVDTNMAHIFPKNVFASPLQAQEFAAFARERVSLSRGQH